jgi:hypothetical protein
MNREILWQLFGLLDDTLRCVEFKASAEKLSRDTLLAEFATHPEAALRAMAQRIRELVAGL